MFHLGPDRAGDRAMPTARECEVIRLLSAGLTTRETATELGIAPSTLKAHLAAIRTKLRARNTAHALVLCERLVWTGASARASDRIQLLAGQTELLGDLATALRDCSSFSEAWSQLNARLGKIGVHSVNFAMIAEPQGTVTNGTYLLASSLNHEIRTLYDLAGGAAIDPFIRGLAYSYGIVRAEPAGRLPAMVEMMPAPFQRFRQALCDHRIALTLSANLCDEVTGAPFGLAWNIHRDNHSAFQRSDKAMEKLNRDVARLFWLIIQSKGWLRNRVSLTVRQREALMNAARGYTSVESADRMGISVRALEKLLAQTRAALGAPTTAAAIYRASVFRVLN